MLLPVVTSQLQARFSTDRRPRRLIQTHQCLRLGGQPPPGSARGTRARHPRRTTLSGEATLRTPRLVPVGSSCDREHERPPCLESLPIGSTRSRRGPERSSRHPHDHEETGLTFGVLRRRRFPDAGPAAVGRAALESCPEGGCRGAPAKDAARRRPRLIGGCDAELLSPRRPSSAVDRAMLLRSVRTTPVARV